MLDAKVEGNTLGAGKGLEELREPLRRSSRPRWDEGTFGHLKLSAVEWAEFMLETPLSEQMRAQLRRERDAWLGKKRRGARGSKHYKVRRKKKREAQRRLRHERGSDEQTIRAVYKRCVRNWKTKAVDWMSEREFEELARRVPLIDGEPFWIVKARRVWFRRKDPELGFVRENVEVLVDREVVDLV